VTTAFRYLGRPVSIPFALANTQTEVLHGLGEIPDGYIVLNADANIKRAPGKQWTKTLAYLQADMASATAIVVFGVFREGVQSVSATVTARSCGAARSSSASRFVVGAVDRRRAGHHRPEHVRERHRRPTPTRSTPTSRRSRATR
jgi:hypothetical protein